MEDQVKDIIKQSLNNSMEAVSEMAASYAQPYLSQFAWAVISDLHEAGYEIIEKPKAT